jgi:hypothetical protein
MVDHGAFNMSFGAKGLGHDSACFGGRRAVLGRRPEGFVAVTVELGLLLLLLLLLLQG